MKLPKIVRMATRIKTFFSVQFKNKQQLLNNPLLSTDDIVELMLRVQQQKKSPAYQHDIAHRKLGDVSSIYRGQGMDYEESRHYQAGDDPRYMNWQLTARSGQHFMKVFREERQPGAFILVDRRASMRFGTQQQLKVTAAVKAAATAAFFALQKNYSVAAVILDKEAIWFKESHNKQAVFDFINQAAKPAMPVSHEQNANEASLHDVLQTINATVTKGATIYLISDFHDLDKKSQAILFALSARHPVNAIQITDPAETQLPQAGLLSLHSAELENTISINSSSQSERDNYRRAAEKYFSTTKELFASSAMSYQQLLTTDDVAQIVNL